MNLKMFLSAAAVVALLYGVSLAAGTAPMMAMYGITLDAGGTLIAQLFGAALIGFAVLNWMARDLTDAAAQRAVVFGNMAGDFVGLGFAAAGQLRGVANTLGWSSVAIYALLVLGFAYFAFMKKPATA